MHHATERRIAARIVDRALAAGFMVSVHDGEDFAISKSRDRAAILREMGATDSDTLIFRRPDGSRVGSVWLIWGNGEDVVADHTTEPETEALFV